MSKGWVERCEMAVAGLEGQIKDWRRNYPAVPIVFSQDLQGVDFREIRHIWVADNPGTQELAQGRYLAPAPGKGSTAGNNADWFFRWAEIRDQVLILNKTPIFSENTADLKNYRTTHPALLAATQVAMAELAFALHREISVFQKDCRLWISGIAGCWKAASGQWCFRNRNGTRPASATLPEYFEAIRMLYGGADVELRSRLHIVKHFSYWAIFSDLSLPGGGKMTKTSLLVSKPSPAVVLGELARQPWADALFRSI